MAIVLQHQHFCPLCDEAWRCTCWACDRELDELPCNACKMVGQDVQTKRYDACRDPGNVVDKQLHGDIVLG